MADSVAPEFVRFIAAQRPEALALKARAEGQVGQPIFLSAPEAARLLPVAARRAAGFFRPTKRTEVAWVEGESEFAVVLPNLRLRQLVLEQPAVAVHAVRTACANSSQRQETALWPPSARSARPSCRA